VSIGGATIHLTQQMSGFGNRIAQFLVNQVIDKMQLHRLPFFQRAARRTVNSMKAVEDATAAAAELKRTTLTEGKKSMRDGSGTFAKTFKVRVSRTRLCLFSIVAARRAPRFASGSAKRGGL